MCSLPLFFAPLVWGQLLRAGVLVQRLVHWCERRPGFFVPQREIAERNTIHGYLSARCDDQLS